MAHITSEGQSKKSVETLPCGVIQRLRTTVILLSADMVFMVVVRLVIIQLGGKGEKMKAQRQDGRAKAGREHVTCTLVALLRIHP